MDNSDFAWRYFTTLEEFLRGNRVPQYIIDELDRYGDYFKDRQWTEESAVYHRFNNGSQYLGLVKNGKRWGIGLYVCNNGNIFMGNYVNGEMVGRGFFFDVSQEAVYWGEWSSGQMSGRGYLRGRNFESEGRYYNGEEVENFYVKRFDRELVERDTGGGSDSSENGGSGCLGIVLIVVLISFLLGMCH